MFDTMNEIVKFSPFGGQLILEEVKGTVSGKLNPENDVKVTVGGDRTMYSYIPASGCPHAKQSQVLMVLRNESTKESAEALMKELKLDQLAEERHFILLFPNPADTGWNYAQDPERDDDAAFLVRCFAALPRSKGKVAGFNGMIFYIGASPEASAMISTLAVTSPLDAAAIMIGAYPKNYVLPKDKGAEQTAWVYEDNPTAENWLRKVNAPLAEEGSHYWKQTNPHVQFYLSHSGLNADTVKDAWEKMFSETRRWRNDTFGIYQRRINFTEKGFTAHVNDTSLGDNNGMPHTWYEYIPERLRGTNQPVPLLFYFHGINCIALYGAEQSSWVEIADRDGLIVVFPDPSIEERWNVWDDRRIPSDADYIMSLLDHMKQVHTIDESRIYLSGFSMGSMFTNAMASLFPDVFAGGVACNGPDQGYLMTLDASVPGLKMFRPNTVTASLTPSSETESPAHRIIDEKKKEKDYRFPLVQFAGILDGVGLNPKKHFPMKSPDDGMWIGTVQFWVHYNHLHENPFFSENTVSGLASDACVKTGRYIDQSWCDADGNDLYHFVTVERMPHAVDLPEFELGWNIIRRYSRNRDGSLTREKEDA